MTRYSKQPWGARFATLGDEAENVYFEHKPLGPTTRWGFRRPEGVAVSKFPNAVAHTPDAVTYQHYVEVMGMGKDGVLKSVKVEKWAALQAWQKISKLCGMTGGVMLFVWNSSRKEFAILNFVSMTKLVKRSILNFGVQRFENDDNEYYPIPWEWLAEAAVWTQRVEETKGS